jgi:hypothetical protein
VNKDFSHLHEPQAATHGGLILVRQDKIQPNGTRAMTECQLRQKYLLRGAGIVRTPVVLVAADHKGMMVLARNITEAGRT